MTQRLLPFLFASLILAILPRATGQDPAAASPPYESTLAQLDKIDAGTTKKAEALRQLINQELLDRHITDSAAQSLRFGLRAVSPSAGSEPLVNAVSAANLTAENTGLVTAIKSFEAEWTAAQAERPPLIKKACAELRAATETAVRTAHTAGEVDAVLAAIGRMENAVPVRNTVYNAPLGTNQLSSYANILRAIRKIIVLQSSQPVNASELSPLMSQLPGMHSSTQGAIDESALQQRVQETLAPYLKVQDEAQEKIENLLIAGKPAAEINTAITKLEEVIENSPQAPASAKRRDLNAAIQVYRTLSCALAAIEAGQTAQAHRTLSGVRSTTLQPMGSAKVPVFTQLVADWDKKIEESATRGGAGRRTEIHNRLAAAKSPADLEALGIDVAKLAGESRDRETDALRNMAANLNILAAAWATANPSLLIQRQFPDGDDQPFAADMVELRRRVERQVIASSLRVPELLQPPLAAQPLNEAIESYTGILAEKGEWRRMLQIIEERPVQNRTAGLAQPESDLAGALHAFITAQNMELAEQWREAMQSYKAVLRSTSEHAPVKEAAARIKVLNKEHADALQPPAPRPAPTNAAPQPPQVQ